MQAEETFPGVAPGLRLLLVLQTLPDSCRCVLLHSRSTGVPSTVRTTDDRSSALERLFKVLADALVDTERRSMEEPRPRVEALAVLVMLACASRGGAM